MTKKIHIPLSERTVFKYAMSNIENIRAILDLMHIASYCEKDKEEVVLKHIDDCAFAVMRMVSDMIINLRKTNRELLEENNEQ